MFNVGDIFYSSWGYDQTNVSFYQVVEKRGKTTAVLREIKQNTVEGSTERHGMACDVVGVKDAFIGDEIKKRHGKYGFKLSCSERLYKWDGKPCYKSWYY